MGMRELRGEGERKKRDQRRRGRHFMPHACLPPKIPLLTWTWDPSSSDSRLFCGRENRYGGGGGCKNPPPPTWFLSSEVYSRLHSS